MPMPQEFQHPEADFDAILATARDCADLATRNQTWTMIDAVLRVFRRRLTPAQALDFADALPALVRAMFVADWDLAAPILPFSDRVAMTAEAQAVRPHHNFSPDTAIVCVARAIRERADPVAFEAVLARLPEGARAFWSTDVV